MSERLCIDCKHCVKPTVGTNGYECRNPGLTKRDLVDGSTKYLLCVTHRSTEHYKHCGILGKGWEPVYVEAVAQEGNKNETL